ncbi:MAG: pilus assembly protein PilY [Nevskia sp.]|nr:pilus assembly protein PilY [Nevskia sp.]
MAAKLRRFLIFAARYAALCALAGFASLYPDVALAVPPTLAIFQSPLTVAIPAHPQVLFAVGNSESMDGNLAGAIMAGSGSLGSSLSLLQSSSSPTCFTSVAGFTPPLSAAGTGGCAAGTAPYTVSSGGNLVDNSPSRLNVAKAGIAAILTSFMPTADFALETYSTSGTNLYTTWLYQMSPSSGNFVFTNTQTAGNRYVTNPCYNYTTVQLTNATLYADCRAIDTSGQVTEVASVNTAQYMQVSPVNAGSSDDPLINDVLYAGGGIDPVCLVYGGPSPLNPYTGTGSFSLSTYNNNGVSESYSSQVNNCARTTTPTNAGFVPYTPQTIYIQRGFGYGGGQSATTGNVVVPMKSAGQVPTTSTVATAIANFTPYLNPETNSTGTTEIKASAGQSALPAILAGAKSYYQNSNPASSNGCTATRYVILVTDGLPTLDLNGKSWPPPGTVSATGYGMTVAFNADGSLNTAGTNDQAVKDTITNLAALNTAGIKTYIVGLGAGVDPTTNPTAAQVLTAMAIAGGTNTYFPATSPSALVSDLSNILAQIIGATQSVATSAVNSTGLRNGSIVYQAQFSTQDTYQDWTGNLSAYNIDPTTAIVSTTANWSAQTQLDTLGASSRLIATWQPATSSGIPFEWLTGNASASSTSGITPSSTLATALTSNTVVPVAADSADATQGLDRLTYLRGDSSKEQRNSGLYRNRTHKLGDIVDSSPIYIGAPNGDYAFGSYSAFVTAKTSRTAMIYVGANDGMLHAFNASTGNELFAFIPNGVFANLPMLTSPFYNAQHHFFVDGSPKYGDVTFSDGSWHTVLASGEAAGGNTIFALDVTNPASNITSESTLASAVLWEYSDTDLGLTYSVPAFAAVNATVNGQTPGFAVFFGNGYNSTNGKPVLYAVNPQTGALLAKIDLCASLTSASGVCDTTKANGLSSVTVVNSTGALAQPADLVYAGDLQGNLWRIKISDTTPSNWASNVTVLFKAKDSSGNAQPITVAPAVSLNPSFPRLLGPMVFFSTGELLTVSDLSATQTQTIYGVYDPGTATAGTGPTYSRATNLVQQTLTTATLTTSAGTQSVLVASGNAVSLPTKDGWYIDLSLQSGMRGVTNPRIEPGGGLVLTTYTPNTSQCTGGGSAYLLVLNFATGGAFAVPEFIIPGNTAIDNSNQVTISGTTYNPVGLSLGNVYATAATIISSNGAPGTTPGNCVKIITKSDGTVQTVFDACGGQKRTAWWEVQ